MKSQNIEKIIIKSLLKESLENCYTCSRVWSAWSYETMSQDDFHHIPDDDELLDDIVESMHPLYHDDDEKYLEKIGVKAYYNENIENNFDSTSFKDDYFDYIDLDLLLSHKNVNEVSLSEAKTSLSNKNKKTQDVGLQLGVNYLNGKIEQSEINTALERSNQEDTLEILNGLKTALFVAEKYGLEKLSKNKRTRKPS